MQRNWYLVGMMGSGKTTVGRKLASLSGRVFIDLDEQITNATGMGIPELFEALGEAGFRIQESQELLRLQPAGLVVATAGGSILTEENRQHMRRTGITIYLRTDPKVLAERLAQERVKRPLLANEHWSSVLDLLFEQRRDLYGQADLIIDTEDRSPGSVAQLAFEMLTELEAAEC